ncbi:MAG: hypothetical protein WAX29_01560 [Propionibacterium sp.]
MAELATDVDEGTGTEGVDAFVSHFGALMSASGMPGLSGHVFALLLASPQARLTARQIGAALHISPAAVSGATKYLAGVGLTRRLRVPGSRQVVHAMVGDNWYEAMLTRNNLMETSRGLLEEGSRAAGGVRTDVGRRLWLNAQLFERLGVALDVALKEWNTEREELLASVPATEDEPA